MPPKATKKAAKPREDPYYAAQRSINEKLTQTKQLFQTWKQYVERGSTNNNDLNTFEQNTRELNMLIKEIKHDIGTINRSIEFVEKDRARFAQITDEDLRGRYKFVHDITTDLSSMQEYIDSPRVKSKLEQNKNSALGGTNHKLQDNQSGQQYVAQRYKEQRDMQAESDAVLDDMSSTLQRLTTNANIQNQKLQVHQQLTNEMLDNMDDTQGLMNTAIHRAEYVLNKSTKGKWLIIGIELILIVILFILIVHG